MPGKAQNTEDLFLGKHELGYNSSLWSSYKATSQTWVQKPFPNQPELDFYLPPNLPKHLAIPRVHSKHVKFHYWKWSKCIIERWVLEVCWVVVLDAMYMEWNHSDFWSNNHHNACKNSCPYNFSLLMFDEIMRDLKFTISRSPAHCFCFWEGRDIIHEWNQHINIFVADLIICLDKRMSIWFQKWTCFEWLCALTNGND